MIYKLKMGSDTICYIKSDLKNKFSYFKFEKDTVFQRNKADNNNNLVFILHGEMEVIYGDLYPRLISGGNMILLTPLSRCVCKAVSTVELIILGFGTLNHSCDKYIFQNLTPFFSLIKYEFRELEIRESLDRFLQLMQNYEQNQVPMADLASRKIQELFIILHAYYTSDELAMLFYPLLGKNMEFKKLVVDYYLHVKSAGEFAELCGYSQGVFQKKFKDVFGETVYQWMQRQKAEYIKHRLMTSEVNLKELADELNFASSVHLNKFCKIWFGMTPSEVRQTFILKKNLH